MKIDDEKYMAEAIKEAQKAFEEEEVPIGAVCVYNNSIIGRGHNRVEALKDPTAHAEILAITAAANQLGDWRLDEVTIYVSAEPCLMCFGAMMLARIARLVFGCEEPRFGFSKSKIVYNMIIEKGVMADEARILLEEFFKLKRIK